MFIKVGVRDFSPAAMVELRLLLAAAVLILIGVTLASGLVVWGRRPAAAIPEP